VDNIHRHVQRGHRVRESAIHGANEVGVAVVASTLTTIAIFVPVLFVGGITGIVFKQFAVIITMALATSLLTSLMLVPMLCSKFLKSEETARASRIGFFFRGGERVLTWLEDRYSALLAWSLRHRATVLLVQRADFRVVLEPVPVRRAGILPRGRPEPDDCRVRGARGHAVRADGPGGPAAP
jgi:HAE1 family hydrophobic/amphiphilic exporter-1